MCFPGAARFWRGSQPGSIAVGDLNGDGKTDVLTAGTGGVSVLINDGLWTPLPPPGGGGGGGG
jgi:hypothetical protein